MVEVQLVCQRRNKTNSSACSEPLQEVSGQFADKVIVQMVLSGHTGRDKSGKDPACATVSGAAFAFCEAVAELQQGVLCRLNSEGRGHLDFRIDRFDPLLFDWLAGLSCGFEKVLQRVLGEYPDAIDLKQKIL